jgi:ParB-like chromosome segregation protein Spo0J
MTTTKDGRMEIHHFAAQFRQLEGGELQKLADDIKREGLREPIITWNGKLLDGRNRLAACELAGVTPRFVTFTGDEIGAVKRIVSANLHRRHDSPSVKAAMIAAAEELVTEIQAKAKANQGARTDLSTSTPAGVKVDSNRELAEVAGVGTRTMTRVRQAQKEAPEVFADVLAGKTTAREAERAVKAKKAAAAPPILAAVPDPPPLPVRQKQIADKKIDNIIRCLSRLEGTMHDLLTTDLTLVRVVATDAQQRGWVRDAEQHRAKLSKFIRSLEGEANHHHAA